MRRTINCIFFVVLLGALVACEDVVGDAEPVTAAPVPVGTGFDFYVLALSWSPGYCQSQGDRANQQQCGAGRSFEWVVHGLWPQFDTGYPEFCEPGTRQSVDRDLSDAMLDIMPSRGLIAHQWRKHGSCAGLEPEDYFEATRRAFFKISKPDIDEGQSQSFRQTHMQVERDFLTANEELRPEHVAVTCDRRFLRDVRICLSNDLDRFVSCPDVDRRHCRLPDMVVVPAQ